MYRLALASVCALLIAATSVKADCVYNGCSYHKKCCHGSCNRVTGQCGGSSFPPFPRPFPIPNPTPNPTPFPTPNPPPPAGPPPTPICTPRNGGGCASTRCCVTSDICTSTARGNVCLPPGPPPPPPPPPAPTCATSGQTCGGNVGCCSRGDVCQGTCVPQPTGPCACKKPLRITLKNVGTSAITYDPSSSGKKSGGKKSGGRKSGRRKSGGKKSGRRSGAVSFVGGNNGLQVVQPGQTFTIQGPFKSSVTIGNINFHTSCSDPLGIGQVFCGQLEVIAGTNTQGTSLCPETRLQRKSSCSARG